MKIKKALIYARVSSKEQESEGFSIPAQLNLLNEYAIQNGFNVVQEFTDEKVAKMSSQTAFKQTKQPSPFFLGWYFSRWG